MISRLSRRSVLDALTFGSGRTCRTSCSGGPDDVDNEVQGVGALDTHVRRAFLAVAVLGRDREQHLAADLLADQGLVPALDHRTGPDLERGRGVTAEVLVERLLAVVYLGGAQLAVWLGGGAEVQSGDHTLGLVDFRRPGRRRVLLAVRALEGLP